MYLAILPQIQALVAVLTFMGLAVLTEEQAHNNN